MNGVVCSEDPRHPACVAAWPECIDGEYHPNCCRFPKSCSCTPVGPAANGPAVADDIAPRAPWHCKQIPNGDQPIVVCERESLAAEIERLRNDLQFERDANNTMSALFPTISAERETMRALADQLAEAVQGLRQAAIIGVYRPSKELAASYRALTAYEEARREQ
jgi:hypothetical protein